jgi:hypothetical protein
MNLLFSLHPAAQGFKVASFKVHRIQIRVSCETCETLKPSLSGLPFPPRTRGTGRIEHLEQAVSFQLKQKQNPNPKAKIVVIPAKQGVDLLEIRRQFTAC